MLLYSPLSLLDIVLSKIICKNENFVYLSRKRKNEHSIEAVFDTVAETLKDFGHYVHKWYKPVSWRQTFREIWQLRKEGYDIYHITGDINYLWLFFPWKKTTMTCHDIGMYKNNPKSIIRILYVFISFISSAIFLKKNNRSQRTHQK